MLTTAVVVLLIVTFLALTFLVACQGGLWTYWAVSCLGDLFAALVEAVLDRK